MLTRVWENLFLYTTTKNIYQHNHSEGYFKATVKIHGGWRRDGLGVWDQQMKTIKHI